MSTISEENQSEEAPVEEKKSDCVVIPEHMKPLFECCKDFEEGRIDSSEFLARTLIRSGEFMQNVKKKRESEQIE